VRKNEEENPLQRNLAPRRGYRPRAGNVLRPCGTLSQSPLDGRREPSLRQPSILLLSRRLYFKLGLAFSFLARQVENPTMLFPPSAFSGSNDLGRRFGSYEAGRNSDPPCLGGHLTGPPICIDRRSTEISARYEGGQLVFAPRLRFQRPVPTWQGLRTIPYTFVLFRL